MKYTIRFSPFAKADKEAIKNYLSKFYPETPHRFIVLLKEHIAGLKENPYIHPAFPENPAYRRMSVGNYFVFYKVNDKERQRTSRNDQGAKSDGFVTCFFVI